MAAAGMGKWIAAAAAVIVAGIALTVFELTRDRTVEEEPTVVESLPEPPAAPLPEAPSAPLTVVPPPVDSPASTQPLRLPAELIGSDGRLDPVLQARLESGLRREGTALTDVRGAISRSGNRFVFQPADGSSPLILLENQLLDRIEHLQRNGIPAPGAEEWILSGIVTEYRDANYFLVRQMTVDPK